MEKLALLLQNGFGLQENYNCAEKIVRGANVAYELGLSEESCRLMSGFGGGMGRGETCGTVTGAVAVLSSWLVQTVAHATPELKPATQSYLHAFEQKLGSLNCLELRGRYRTKEHGCDTIIFAAGQMLDDLVATLPPRQA